MNLDMQIVIMGAFRYALGRMTYVVSSTCNVIEATRAEMPTGQLKMMVNEIIVAGEEGKLGMQMDEDRWEQCRAMLEHEINSRSEG